MALQVKQSGDGRPLGQILVESGFAKPAVVNEALQIQTEARSSALSVLARKVSAAKTAAIAIKIKQNVARNERPAIELSCGIFMYPAGSFG